MPAHEAGISDTEICQFYQDEWTRPIALGRSDFMAWQMAAAPDAQGVNNSLVAVGQGGLVAVMGCTPMAFSGPSGLRNGAALTTWVVSPAARGKGVGTRILAELQARYDVLVGAGITDAALPLYLGAGFTFQRLIPRHFYVADFATLGGIASFDPRAQNLVERRQVRSGAIGDAITLQASDLAKVAQSGIALGDSGFTRSAAMLAWRYDDHPTFAYESRLIRKNGSEGTVVFRQEHANGVSFLHLNEVFGDVVGIDAGLEFMENEARKRGAAFVDVSATLGRVQAVLRARGWTSALDDPLIRLPYLFFPVEYRDPPTTSVVLWAAQDRSTLYDLSQMYLTRGDLDLDRPTMDWYARATE